MTLPNRREFLKRSTLAVSAGALAGCAPGRAGEGAAERTLDTATLSALAEAILPTDLGEEGVGGAVAAFQTWLAGFRPAAELELGYQTHEIRFGPPDPAPGWKAQLEALELEATRRYRRSFGELSLEERREMVRRELRGDDLRRLPDPARARHVSAALLAHHLSSPATVDRSYGVRIERLSCRGLEETGERPPPLDGEART